jgi:hypothetical protein
VSYTRIKGCRYLKEKKTWVVSASMGMGHNRAAYPFLDIAYGDIYLMGEHSEEKGREKFFWKFTKRIYESLSRSFDIPAVGPIFFGILNTLQKIPPYYPVKNRSAASAQVKILYTLMKLSLGNDLKRHLSSKKLPVITTFYASAILVQEFTDLPVYCIICDADINRTWVAKKPKESRIVYCVPCTRAKGRLLQYGVPENKIMVTGFPLPDENVGGPEMIILKNDLSARLARLDPYGKFKLIHGKEVEYYLGRSIPATEHDKPITLTYAIGGAGAQKHIADGILHGASGMIRKGSIKINLVAGTKKNVYKYLLSIIKKHGFENNKNVNLIYDSNMYGYFKKFSSILHKTDILWTKPSELSFYCSLGIPLVVSPPIGDQEKANKKWLMKIGAGIPQPNPKHLEEWLADYLAEGTLAQYAWNAFLNTKKTGTYSIKDLVFPESMDLQEANSLTL